MEGLPARKPDEKSLPSQPSSDRGDEKAELEPNPRSTFSSARRKSSDKRSNEQKALETQPNFDFKAELLKQNENFIAENENDDKKRHKLRKRSMTIGDSFELNTSSQSQQVHRSSIPKQQFFNSANSVAPKDSPNLEIKPDSPAGKSRGLSMTVAQQRRSSQSPTRLRKKRQIMELQQEDIKVLETLNRFKNSTSSRRGSSPNKKSHSSSCSDPYTPKRSQNTQDFSATRRITRRDRSEEIKEETSMSDLTQQLNSSMSRNDNRGNPDGIVKLLESNFSRFEKTLNDLSKGMQQMQAEVNMIKQRVNLDQPRDQ